MIITLQQAIKLLRDLELPVSDKWSVDRIAQKLDWIPYCVNEQTDAKESQEILNQLLIAIADEADIIIQSEDGDAIMEPVLAEDSFFNKLVQKHFLNKDGSRRKPGVIQAIVEFLCEASEESPINKQDLVKKIVTRFPRKSERSIMASINSQVPAQLRVMKKIKVSTNKQGYWIAEEDQ
jgi:hypothetical protein